jgi:lysophospholipid acyltransferase (LPLAT)-like uncharacterized protein
VARAVKAAASTAADPRTDSVTALAETTQDSPIGDEPPGNPVEARKSGLFHTPQFRIARRAVGKLLVRSIGAPLVRAYASSWRYEELHAERKRGAQESGGVILAMWHGRMLCPVPLYKGQDFTILVSASGDGDLSEALLRGFGYDVVRGSASRGGASALRKMLAALGRGSTLAVTPDGPRGPRHSVNPGPAWIARATGHPILPAGYACTPRRELSSWDRYSIPKRGARVVASYGEPIYVARSAQRQELEAVSRTLHESLMNAERAAFAHLDEEPDF